jgi:hypothetical protein
MKTFFRCGSTALSGFLLLAVAFSPTPAASQTAVDLGGIVTLNFIDGGAAESPLRLNDGLPGFELYGDLFMNVRISDEVSAFLELETWRGWEVRLYSGSLTYKISGMRLQIEAGKFAAPFGNFLPRRFAPQNFVYSYPLYNEYRTGLAIDNIPGSNAALLAGRGKFNVGGLAMVARNAYITGVQFLGQLGAAGYHLGLANGALSNPSHLSESKRLLLFGRLYVQPTIGLKIGVSAANGGYLNSALLKNTQPRLQPEKYGQTLAGVDVEYSRGYLVFYGEGVFSRWKSPLLRERLDALAFSVEMRYKILPRLFVAGRYGRIQFSEIADLEDVDTDGKLAAPWEFPIWRFEPAVGYNLSRHALVKAVWQINRTDRPAGDPADNLAAIQMSVFY